MLFLEANRLPISLPLQTQCHLGPVSPQLVAGNGFDRFTLAKRRRIAPLIIAICRCGC
jgi:hypothetical protein